MNVGYLGPRGTFSEQAAHLYLTQHQAAIPRPQLHVYPSIPEALRDVERGNLDVAVVPIENAIEGSVAVTVDFLIHEVNLEITAEVVLPVAHHLMAKPGTDLADIEAVISHPQALAQCRKSLERLLQGVKQLAATSTAEAAQHVASEDRPMAALGTALAAQLYALNILASDMQDIQANATRFVAVGAQRPARTGCDKTSVVFSFPQDRPGNLYRALGSFAERNINLSKLESRPAKQVLGEYLFLVDIEGYVDDPPIAAALAELREVAGFFKVLGSFPRVEYPRVS